MPGTGRVLPPFPIPGCTPAEFSVDTSFIDVWNPSDNEIVQDVNIIYNVVMVIYNVKYEHIRDCNSESFSIF